MVKKSVALERGDIAWIDFSPTKGHEQSGLRPAVVLSPFEYNSRFGMILACPVTSKCKGYFFEVPIRTMKKESFVLVDQLRTFDIKKRVKRISGKISSSEINEILARISILLK